MFSFQAGVEQKTYKHSNSEDTEDNSPVLAVLPDRDNK